MRRVLLLAMAVSIALTWCASTVGAIPAFTRKYDTSCVTCHYAYPKLNGFGKAFKNNGFRYPGGDENYVKDEPVSLGAESYKQVFPEAIWPSDVSHLPPVAFHLVGRMTGRPDHAEGVPATNFEFPHETEVLMAGTLGESFSFFAEVELENEDNATEIAFPFMVQWDAAPQLHLRAGEISPDFTDDAPRLTQAHNNVASLRSRHRWRLRDGQSGFEAWGAGNGPQGWGGGYTWAAGIVNGGGVPTDNNSEKDYFVRGSWKFKGLGEIGGTEGQASETSAHWVDNQLKLTGFGYFGTASADASPDEDIVAVGGTAEVWYRDLIVQGAFMNLDSQIEGATDRTSQAFFVEGDYVLFPWVIGAVRYEWTDANIDVDTPEAVQSLIPALVLLPRANIRIIGQYLLPIDEPSKKADLFSMQIDFAF